MKNEFHASSIVNRALPRLGRPAIGFLAVLFLAMPAIRPANAPAQTHAPERVPGQPVKMTAEQRQLYDRARTILRRSTLPEPEQEVRLCILEAAMAGTIITPCDDSPEICNPRHWALRNERYVVAPGSTPAEAVADLWIVHEGDGVPVPRIWCLRYSSLVMAKGYVQYFQDTHNAAGLAAFNRLLSSNKCFPSDLPHGGEGLFWTKRFNGEDLLPGDQAWFKNPHFDNGRELIRQEAYDEALRGGKSAKQAAAAAEETTDSLAAGEEGSNIFYLGDQRFVRGAKSVARVFRGAYRRPDGETAVDDQTIQRRIFTFTGVQKHMIDDNYTVQAQLRAQPGSVRPADFQIRRVRSPVSPEALVRRAFGDDSAEALEMAIDAMASRNKPPRLVPLGDATIPLFAAEYDWQEQARVRSAIQAVLRVKRECLWWRMREHVGDNRYVLTASQGAATRNFTVGSFCADFVLANLCQAYAAHLPTVPGRLPATFRPEEEFWKNEKQWIRDRKPLYEMQVALCRRALEQWASVTGTLPGRDGDGHIYTAEEKAGYLVAVQKEIAAREQAKKALFEEVLLPWAAAPNGWEGYDAETAGEARQRYLQRASPGT